MRRSEKRLYLAHDVEDPGVLAEPELDLLVAVVHLEDLGPGGPGVVVGTLGGRRRQDLKRRDILGSLQM